MKRLGIADWELRKAEGERWGASLPRVLSSCALARTAPRPPGARLRLEGDAPLAPAKPCEDGSSPRAWRYLRVACALLLLGAGGLFAEDALTEARLQQRFAQAGKAYDEGRTAEAVSDYEALLNEGVRSSALDYNLGNAFFKLGRMGQAVLHYRRAWYESPRDPDIEANMRFAFENAGVTPPRASFVAQALRTLSLVEWLRMGMIAFWSLGLVACVGLVWRASRFVAWRVGVAALLVVIVSAAGAFSWRALYRRPECVVVASGQKVLAGPLADATALFAVPAGAIAREIERNGHWLRIEYDRQTGWIPESACRPVIEPPSSKSAD